MITVRFPSGFSVQYNYLDHADFRNNGIYLGRKSKPDEYSVWVPLECIVEHVAPCRTYFAASDQVVAENNELKRKLERARKQIAKLKKGTR